MVRWIAGSFVGSVVRIFVLELLVISALMLTIAIIGSAVGSAIRIVLELRS